MRKIHKASVLDRVLHHAIHRILEPILDKGFIHDSYSSRKHKGLHAAGKRFRKFAWKLSQNNTTTVWVLKCDIRKFFSSVDHDILIELLANKLKDRQTIDLLVKIIKSFEVKPGKGIPLGNLTSQLFSNIYMDAFDNFIKRQLGVKYYVRYADDFVVLSRDKDYLQKVLNAAEVFLRNKLKLTLHSNKINFQKWHTGVDFLGFIHFPHHSVIRTKTKRRILHKINLAKNQVDAGGITTWQYNQILQSYLGRLGHCRSKGVQEEIKNALANHDLFC
jgi:RNA-directed DNA polymerase